MADPAVQEFAGEPVTVFTADRLVTMDGPDVEALAVAGGRILGRGTLAGARERHPDAAVVELGGTVLPGFHDAHLHLAMASEDLLHLDLSPAATPTHDALLETLRREAEATPEGSWLRGSRYDDAKTSPGTQLTRAELDRVTGSVPTLVVHVACHWGVANSAALERAGIGDRTRPPAGGDFGRDASGRPNGVLLEQALFRFANPAMSANGKTVAPASSLADRTVGLRRAVQSWHGAGLTSICDAMVGPDDFALFAEASVKGWLTLRTGMLVAAPHYDLVHRLGLRSGLGDSRLRFVGVKAFVDGAIGGRTCLTDEPHADGSPGIQTTPADELRELVRTVHADGNRIGVHANGERAIRLVLDAFEEAAAAEPRPGLRHRIEHCSLVDDGIVARIAALGVIAVPFGSYAWYHGGALLDWYGDRVQRMFPHRDLLDAGITVAGSSDYPCGPVEPLLAVQSCVTRTGADGVVVGARQRITVDEALRLYTTGAAEATGEAHLKGTLAPGKLADFVTLGDDPRAVDPLTIGNIPVRSTWVGGEQVWASASGAG